MTYTQNMMKLARGEKLNPIELTELEQHFNEMDNNRIIVSSWQQMDKKIKPEYFDLPINVIYSTALEKDYSSITVSNIPQVYSHLIIFGSGRTTSSNASFRIQDIRARFNGDSGNNYSFGSIRHNGTTSIDAIESLSTNSTLLGIFNSDSSTADDSGSFVTFIPNYSNYTWHKTTLTLRIGYYSGIFSRFSASRWASKESIQTIEFFPDTTVGGDFKQGSIFTVLGVK